MLYKPAAPDIKPQWHCQIRPCEILRLGATTKWHLVVWHIVVKSEKDTHSYHYKRPDNEMSLRLDFIFSRPKNVKCCVSVHTKPQCLWCVKLSRTNKDLAPYTNKTFRRWQIRVEKQTEARFFDHLHQIVRPETEWLGDCCLVKIGTLAKAWTWLTFFEINQNKIKGLDQLSVTTKHLKNSLICRYIVSGSHTRWDSF